MTVWYCCICGFYLFSEPKTNMNEKGNLWDCPFCKSITSIVKETGRNIGLRKFASDTLQDFPSRRFDDLRPQYRPLNYLITALGQARLFVHVATESIDNFFLGMLALKHFEQYLEQRVIVWHPQKMYTDIERLMSHSTFVKGYQHGERPFASGIVIATIEAHQKLIIIDGCVAFKGSANATLDGWTREGEIVEFTTDKKDIWELNKTYFASFMAKKRAG